MRDVLKLCIRNAINDAAGGGCMGLAQHEIDEIMRDLSVEIEAALSQARAEGAREERERLLARAKDAFVAAQKRQDGGSFGTDLAKAVSRTKYAFEWLRSQSTGEG